MKREHSDECVICYSVHDMERSREAGYRAGIKAAVVELRRQADGWRRPLTPSEWTEATAEAYDNAADVVEAVLAPAAKAGEPEDPPCGGSRCHKAADGAWTHSSKSYGTCAVRNAKPSEPCRTHADGKHRRWHDEGPDDLCACGVVVSEPSEPCGTCKGTGECLCPDVAEPVLIRCPDCGGEGRRK